MAEYVDGGFVILGEGSSDFWFLRVNANGDVLINETSEGVVYAYVDVCDDGSLVMTGPDYSTSRIHLLKIDSNGDMVWNSSLLSSGGYLNIEDFVACKNGGYAVFGYRYYGNPVNATDRQMWLLRVDSSGEVQWQKFYGDGSWGYESYTANCVVECTDGGFFLVGFIESQSHYTYRNYLLYTVRTDSDGNVIWNRTVDFEDIRFGDIGVGSVQCSDDGFIVVTKSVRAVKFDSSGNVMWTQDYVGDLTFDPLLNITAGSIVQCSSGGYAISGCFAERGTYPREVLLIRIDDHGEMQWNRTLKGWSDLGPSCDSPARIIERSSVGLVLACSANYETYPVVWLIVTPDSPLIQQASNDVLTPVIGIVGITLCTIFLYVGRRKSFPKSGKDDIIVPTRYRIASWLRRTEHSKPLDADELDSSE
jgi:hypothetical protein